MTTELVKRRELDHVGWNLIHGMCDTIHKSRMVSGVSSPEAAAFVLLRAYEMGFPLSSCGDNFQVVQGKVALTSQGMLALIHSRPDLVKMEINESTDERCTVTMTRSNGFAFTITYTLEDAKRANLIKPNGAWETYPSNMLRWRAISTCARIVVPDLLAGLYLASELGSEIADGEVVSDAD